MARDHGVHAGKLRVGVDPRADLHRLEQVRTALLQSTAEPTLAIRRAVRGQRRKRARRIRAIEGAFRHRVGRGCDFARRLPRSQAGVGRDRRRGRRGQGSGRPGQFLPHFHHRSADVIELDIGVTGITGALQLADAAYGYELPVTLTAAPGNLHVHLAAVMPYFMSAEIVDPAPASPVCTSDVRIEQGWAVAGDEPGHGLTVQSRNADGGAARSGNDMKITGYRVEQYLMKMDRAVGDANLPSGVEMLPGSILFLETDEDVTRHRSRIRRRCRQPVRRHRRCGSARGGRAVDPDERLPAQGRQRGRGQRGAQRDRRRAVGHQGEARRRTAVAHARRAATGASRRTRAASTTACRTKICLPFYRRMAERGIDSGKLKVGLDLAADLRRLGIMRDALEHRLATTRAS